jgi:gamma-glutamyltranspeptidase/glutathione hydrolase
MVASTHWLASASGMAMLERGGNAFDAAVAAGFVLQVVEPHLNGPGGEVPILLHAVGNGETTVLAGQGPAPQAATIAHYRDLGLDLVPGTGQLAACVPGAVDAWLTLLERYGTLSFPEVIEPAISYARNGFPALPSISRTIATVADQFSEHWPSSAKLYLRDGAAPPAGARLTNPVLADTYQKLSDAAGTATGREAGINAARDAFYRGFVAEAIGRFAEVAVRDVSGRDHRGLITAQDLANWRTPVEEPLSYDYHGFRVFKTGPWGQGPVFAQQLALLAGYDLATLDPDGPDFIHTVVECSKLAYADREAYYGDPEFVDVPLKTLLSAEYNDARRALVGDTADGELRPGSPDGRPPRLPMIAAPTGGAAGAGEPTVDRSGTTRGDTCHVDVVDAAGNFVSATPSGGWLQSNPVIPELGFALGSRAQMFWLEEGLPASLAPGKRPRTTLTPSLAFRDGAPYLAFGTPGGDQQDQWSLQLFLRHVHSGQNLQEAIDAPAFHSAHFPSSFWPRESAPRQLVVESRYPASTIEELRRRGHEVTVGDGWSLGRLSAVSKGSDGFLRAAANPRGMQGYAVGR